jgi:chaperonin cofactor prefoldin
MTEKARKVVKNLKEKDEELLNEIKRIKRLQKGLYKEYEIGKLGDD